MTAKEAAAELNVSGGILYAYVSRGIVRPEAESGTRTRRYLAADIRARVDKSKTTTQPNEDTHPPFFLLGCQCWNRKFHLLAGMVAC